MAEFNSVISFLEGELGASRPCLLIAEQTLRYASHVPLVTNIARGAGFCYYYARIAESIGSRHLREQRVSRISGKGSKVHKLLGIISLRAFSRGINSVLNSDPQALIDEVLQEEYYLNVLELRRGERSEITSIASRLMSNLITNLPLMLSIINVDCNSKVFPIVEQQFVDYHLHMRGVPDLILEFPNEKAAIVIEWKTSRETPLNHEKAQTICYALMEATRLGYRSKDKVIRAIIGEMQEKNGVPTITGVKILPVIIRPSQRGRIEPHPSMTPKPDEIRERYRRFKKLVSDVCLMAEHLTLLTADIRMFAPNEGDVERLCSRVLRFNDREVKASIFRIKPRQIFSRTPERRDAFPCVTSTGRPFCHYNHEYGPCEFYFGRGFGKKTDFDKAMWSLRFKVFREKERMLLPYRALHELFRSYPVRKFVEKIKDGQGFEWHIGEAPYPSTFIKMQVAVYKRGKKLTSFRIDIIDEIQIQEEVLVGSRSLRRIEASEEVYRVISEGKPVLISVMDSWTPLLSINVFGRVDEVNVEDDRIRYVIGLPSSALQYSMTIFREYLETYPDMKKDLLISEMNVDLLNAELQSIDAMQRALRKELNDENDEYVRRGLQEQINEMEEIKNQLVPLERLLSKLIGRGLISRGDY